MYSSPNVTVGRICIIHVVAAGLLTLLSSQACAQSSVDQLFKEEIAKLDASEATLKQHPGDAEARQAEVNTAIAVALKSKSAGRNEDALSFLLRAKYWVPDNVELLLDTGIQEESMNLFKDADAALAEAQRLRPGDPKTLYAIARVKMDLGQTQASDEAWRSYLDQRPDDASAHYGYGVLLQMLQRSEDARTQFLKSVQLSPQQGESYYRLGELAREEGDQAQAKAYYEQTLAHVPSHAGALTGLAILAYEAHQYEEAEGELEKALAASPNFQTAHYYHGLILAKLGRKQESQAELDLAVRLTNEQNAHKDQMKQLSAQPYQPK